MKLKLNSNNEVLMKILMNRLLALLNDESPESTDYHIARSLIVNLDQVPTLSIVDMSALCCVSKSKLSKFVRNMGFDDYKDFRLEAVQEHKKAVYDIGGNISIADCMRYRGEKEYFNVLKNDIDLLYNKLDRSVLKELVSDIYYYKKVAAFGTGHSEAAALYLQAAIAYMYKVVYTAIGDQKQEAYIRDADSDTLIIIFSNSGRYIHISQLREGEPEKEVFGRTKAKIAVITSNPRMKDDPEVDLCLHFSYSSQIQNHPILFQLISEYIVFEFQKEFYPNL